jgi:hypothetical protein
MFSVPGGIRTVVNFACILALFSIPAFSQTPNFVRQATNSFSARNVPLVPSCFDGMEFAALNPRQIVSAGGSLHSSCDIPSAAASVPHPCGAQGSFRPDCRSPADQIRTDLDAVGKDGRKISRARDKVLEILESENACTEWFREKDANPASTFRTLSFALDRKGEDSVQEFRDAGSAVIFRNPYVAKVFQGDGAYGTVTVNLNGAFFRPVAIVHRTLKDRTFFGLSGTRVLQVGPYEGDTLRAQILTLLHEFGHVLDILPQDLDNFEGRSVQNTNEVLRHCRAEIESESRRTP